MVDVKKEPLQPSASSGPNTNMMPIVGSPPGSGLVSAEEVTHEVCNVNMKHILYQTVG